ncbi:hypothetical protein VTL71DRAFT_625 [Oculimacula yallundae]|uniref:Uncharacterized protein n=1 Tax=Oculimacula yallundae TaxID=86028 RepID=A0ABR4D0L0_9HELO
MRFDFDGLDSDEEDNEDSGDEYDDWSDDESAKNRTRNDKLRRDSFTENCTSLIGEVCTYNEDYASDIHAEVLRGLEDGSMMCVQYYMPEVIVRTASLNIDRENLPSNQGRNVEDNDLSSESASTVLAQDFHDTVQHVHTNLRRTIEDIVGPPAQAPHLKVQKSPTAFLLLWLQILVYHIEILPANDESTYDIALPHVTEPLPAPVSEAQVSKKQENMYEEEPRQDRTRARIYEAIMPLSINCNHGYFQPKLQPKRSSNCQLQHMKYVERALRLKSISDDIAITVMKLILSGLLNGSDTRHTLSASLRYLLFLHHLIWRARGQR